MTKFQNKTGHTVFLDLGDFRAVRPDEIIELKGAVTAHPLTAIFPGQRMLKDAPKRTPKKKVAKKSPVPPTSGTI